ncbi:DNA polymerase I [Rapidithrix thailandica]|uniref:DNA polymerase I n=1 Tax=Rapidithrix thailandica TaxID=413964 RepID=A0AAW9RTW3_9BACT
MPDKKLFLLDAMALIYRAHFAFSKNPRINSKGLNTGAPLGFTNSLIEIIKKEKPTHIGVAFDTKAPTFRHIEYKEYKAQRQEQPEDITTAIPIIKDIVKGFQIPVLEKDGFEADDIIGTLAKRASKEGFEVYMMTPDKDYGQLVEEHIYLYKPAFMGNGVEILGVEEVLAKWKVERIEQVIDCLGLQGDSVDNIPGIPGIGPKTATKLLAEYGTVENLVANTDKLKGKQKERVIEFGEQGILSKKLATIDINVPVDFDEEALKYSGFNEPELKNIFEDLEFRTLSKRLFGESTPATAKQRTKTQGQQTSLFDTAPVAEESEEEVQAEKKTLENTKHSYHLIDTKDKVDSLIHFLSLQEEFCFDTETTSIQAYEAKLVGMSFSYYASEGYYVPVNDDNVAEVLEAFKPVFANEKIAKIGQNIKYDLTVLHSYGVEVKGDLFDTMLAHYLLEPDSRHNMDVLAENYLNYIPLSIETLIGKKGKKQGNMQDVDPVKVAEYASEDADVTWQLKAVFAPKLAKLNQEKLFREIEMPLVNVLAQIEENGVKVDIDSLKKYSNELEEEVKAIEQKIFKEAGEEFNIGSPKQLGVILFEKLKLIEKPKKTKSGQYATGEEILITLAKEHQIVQDILDFRQLQKLKSTYVDALPALISEKDGLIHTSYNQAVAATGRLSSTNPNLQNIPIRTERGREIRKAFVARDENYVIMAADYSQVELRIMASFSRDEHMIEAFKEKKDIHAATAARINKVPLEEVSPEMRRKAKTANFGIIYGISAFGLSQRLNIPRKEAGELIDTYFQEFPSVKEYMDWVINFAREQEYVETIMGRRRYLRDINSRNFTQRGFAERNAINAPIQGSAADVIKKAMIDIHQWMQKEKLRSKMIMQVHDELVFDVHKDELEIMQSQVKKLMENAVKLGVPLEVEVGVGNNWLEAH